MSEAFEVRKYGYSVPLAEGTCQTCGRPVAYNLGGHPGIVLHVGDGEPNNCGDPWPARKIEQPQIDGEALTGIGVSAIRRDPPFDGPSVAVGASVGLVGPSQSSKINNSDLGHLAARR